MMSLDALAEEIAAQAKAEAKAITDGAKKTAKSVKKEAEAEVADIRDSLMSRAERESAQLSTELVASSRQNISFHKGFGETRLRPVFIKLFWHCLNFSSNTGVVAENYASHYRQAPSYFFFYCFFISLYLSTNFITITTIYQKWCSTS